MEAAEYDALTESWLIHLTAERKSPQTLRGYGTAARRFGAWARDNGGDHTLDRRSAAAFLADLLRAGASAETVRTRAKALKQFSRWLAEEEETDHHELATLTLPKADDPVVPELTEEQLADLIAACAGRDLRARRDEAIIRLMAETGARAGEVVGMSMQDVSIRDGVATIRRGKGGKGRRVAFGPQTARAIDRYLRLRRSHKLAETPALWLGDRGQGFGYYALHQMFKQRGAAAGMPWLHPHILRHTFAGRWLEAGGSENGLLASAGWSSRAMIDRYSRSTSQKRAIEEARRLGLGDV
ncbi:tyrosine-type recombinase/integrase [Actinocorallia sp. API 0066]|uniref:tyrosine-type recombinase/integrase n=1 Tax=Actinocorallia sp. API 0066 TaxID=2896846 RepID=UPI001E5B8198|nr:tyrosine-type recombinase/integrase [Actinocorallia sp. API 0066]MCD0450793.1 tyrosine-type recombinase/integrase [Actinocorallia sp. API 0066]